VSFADITLCVASQRVFITVGVYFVIDSVRKLLDTLVYNKQNVCKFSASTPHVDTGLIQSLIP